MGNRLDLHEELCKIVDMKELNGDRHVYFQPPESLRLNYPCIVYSINDIWKKNADNKTYMQRTAYTVTVIDSDPDSEIIQKVLELSMCSFDRSYISDNLNHYVFTLYF